MPDFAVSVAIRGDDQISGNLRRLSGRFDRFGRNADRALSRATKSASMFRAVLGGTLVAGAISRGFTAMTQGVGATVRGFAEMDQALTSAGAKFQLSKLSAQGAASAMEALSASARQVGADTEFTASQAAQGLEFLAMAGFTAEQAVSALPIAVDLATASNTDLARATDIASDALGAFGLDSTDAATKAANLRRIVDVFAQTTASANVGMENLFETFKMGGPIMTTAGQSLESFAAMTALMGNAGIKGSLAGTVLKNTIQRLVAPVGKAKTQLKQLGVVVADSEGNMRNVADILDDFARATKNMGTAQRAAAISTIFGARAVSGISTILDKGIPSLREFRGQLDNAQGASKRMSDEMRGSLINRLKTLQSSLLEVGMKVLEAFQDKFPGALDAAIAAVRSFDVKPIISGIKFIIDVVKVVWQWFKEWKTVVMAAVVALGLLKAVIWLVNIALYANPIVVIIVAIGALIAIIVLVIVYWEDLVDAWQVGLYSIVDGTNSAANWIAEKFGALATPVINAAIKIANGFGEAWHGIKSGVSATVSFVISAWRKLKGALGFDVSDLPSAAEVDKWFGVDKEYKGRELITEDQAVQGYKDAFADIATALGAKPPKPAETPAPNRAREEARQQSIDLRGQIDIFSPEGFSAQATSSSTAVNGKKSGGVDWRSKAGRNTGS